MFKLYIDTVGIAAWNEYDSHGYRCNGWILIARLQLLHLSTSDYTRKIFSKTPEKTARGPSGIKMSHWKAACYDPDIAAVQTLFMDIPFNHGFSLKRWEQSIHCILQKKTEAYANSFRNIQLYQGDFNGALKLIHGRRLMRHADEHQINSTKLMEEQSIGTAMNFFHDYSTQRNTVGY